MSDTINITLPDVAPELAVALATHMAGLGARHRLGLLAQTSAPYPA